MLKKKLLPLVCYIQFSDTTLLLNPLDRATGSLHSLLSRSSTSSIKHLKPTGLVMNERQSGTTGSDLVTLCLVQYRQRLLINN